MRILSLAAACILSIPLLPAAEPAPRAAVKPHPVTLTFYISGAECASCVEAVCGSVREVKSVTDVSFTQLDGFANVSFDTHVASAHQIAQAVAGAMPLHGRPYSASLVIRVPDYAKEGNAAKVDAVFAKREEWVDVKLVDRARGEFEIHFKPLKLEADKAGPQGWNPGHFGHAIHDPEPKGLGLAFVMVKEGQQPAPGARP